MTLSSYVPNLELFLQKLYTDTDPTVDALSESVSVLSQQVSILNASNATQINVVKGVQNISSITLIAISGLSLQLSANRTYQIEGQLVHQMLVGAPNTMQLGLSTGALTFAAAGGQWQGGVSVANNEGVIGAVIEHGTWNAGTFGAVTYSVLVPADQVLTKLDGIIGVSATGGTLQIKAAVSVATQTLQIRKGSFLRAYVLI